MVPPWRLSRASARSTGGLRSVALAGERADEGRPAAVDAGHRQHRSLDDIVGALDRERRDPELVELKLDLLHLSASCVSMWPAATAAEKGGSAITVRQDGPSPRILNAGI